MGEEEVYRNKLRLRVEKLMGPKRKQDITSCDFMRDLEKALFAEFKSDMQRMFRRREFQQAIHSHHKVEPMKLKEDHDPSKSFFKEDSDDEWVPFYSEESDDEYSKGDFGSIKQISSVMEKIQKLSVDEVEKLMIEGDELEGIAESSTTADSEETQRMIIIEKAGQEMEQEQDLVTEQKDTTKTTSSVVKSEVLDGSEVEEPDFEDLEDEDWSMKTFSDEEGGKEKLQIFSEEETFEKYQLPVNTDMENIDSIEELYMMCEKTLQSLRDRDAMRDEMKAQGEQEELDQDKAREEHERQKKRIEEITGVSSQR